MRTLCPVCREYDQVTVYDTGIKFLARALTANHRYACSRCNVTWRAKTPHLFLKIKSGKSGISKTYIYVYDSSIDNGLHIAKTEIRRGLRDGIDSIEIFGQLDHDLPILFDIAKEIVTIEKKRDLTIDMHQASYITAEAAGSIIKIIELINTSSTRLTICGLTYDMKDKLNAIIADRKITVQTKNITFKEPIRK